MAEIPQQAIYPDIAREGVEHFIPRDSRSALDVGCARGGFGRTIRNHLGPDARVVGIEAVPEQASVARTGHGFDEVVDGFFPAALEGRDDRFDTIFFNDVLEHIVDPWQVLEHTHERLTPGGRVVAAIPSIQYAPVLLALLRGRWDYADMGTLDRTHVRFFTRATMVELFEGTGYRVEQCAGANSAKGLDWAALTLKRRAFLRVIPQSEWLHYVIVARSVRS